MLKLHIDMDKNFTRREFGKKTLLAGLSTMLLQGNTVAQNTRKGPLRDEYDFIIVGSGAGGGPLACNLAIQGFSVLVLEAGEKDIKTDNYKIPAYHGMASEDKDLAWQYFVKHYSGDRDKQDSKYVDGKGIFYPRGATIGGSTAVNALITVYPHAKDFEYIADITEDDSWSPRNMRKYIHEIENCHYLNYFDAMRQDHGIGGWLPTRYHDLDIYTLLRNIILAGVIKANLAHNGKNLLDLIFNEKSLDPNQDFFEKGGVGPVKVPLTANKKSYRHSVREYLLQIQSYIPDQLHIETNALASKVLFDADKNAIGVEFLKGSKIYEADPYYSSDRVKTKKVVKAKREVILSAGAFNTPQLLQLSGIGNAQHLEQKGIPVIADLPGVGENLQDRYELGILYKLKLETVNNCTFGNGYDECLNQLNWFAKGPYTTNGSIVANIAKSNRNLDYADLFNFALLAPFKGYYPGYSKEFAPNRDTLTWAILKGHTENNVGQVKIQSTDPTKVPSINFKYFADGDDFYGSDMKALISGVKNIRNLMNHYHVRGTVVKETWPGAAIKTDDQLRDFISKEAWGHHASCTCPIGSDDDNMAVLDKNFKVRGVNKLRVVDASVFPKIPGFFIAMPIYLISEKATDDILKDMGMSRFVMPMKDRLDKYNREKKQQQQDKILQEVDIKVYPNPVVNDLFFDIQNLPKGKDYKTTRLLIVNANADVIYNEEMSYQAQVHVDLSNKPAGTYYYIIDIDGISKRGKIIKEQ